MYMSKKIFLLTNVTFFVVGITAILFAIHTNLAVAGAWEDNNCQWVGSEGVYLKCQCWDGTWRQATTVNNALLQCPAQPTPPPPAPSVTLQVQNTTAGTGWTTSDITINYSDTIYLSWSSSNASSCSGSNFTASGTSGTQTSVVEPSAGGSTTYTVSCSGGGGTSSDSITVTRLNNQPTASILLKNLTTNSSWSSNARQINMGDEIAISWSSTLADVCYSFGFDNGSTTAGTTEDVEEPDGYVLGQKDYSVGCEGDGGIKYSNSPTVYIYRPTVPLQVSSDGGSTWTGSDTSITAGEDIYIKWTSTNAVSCTGTNFTMNGTSSTQTSVTEPTAGNSITYTATCSNARGSGSDSITVTANAAPTAALQVSSDGGSTWTGSDVTIAPTDEIHLQWSSTNADSCSGYNFSTGGSTGSTQTSVTEPTAGNSTTYTVVCSSGASQDSDSLQVTVEAGVGASLTADDTVVHSGDTVTLDWNVGTSDPSTCEIRLGNSALSGYSTLSTATGSLNYTVNAESTVTLDCESGANLDEVTIFVLPEFQET